MSQLRLMDVAAVDRCCALLVETSADARDVVGLNAKNCQTYAQRVSKIELLLPGARRTG